MHYSPQNVDVANEVQVADGADEESKTDVHRGLSGLSRRNNMIHGCFMLPSSSFKLPELLMVFFYR